jgi:hypothetical protein
VASLKRWVAANLPEEVRRDRVTVLGDEAEPGAQAQIDYGIWACGSIRAAVASTGCGHS